VRPAECLRGSKGAYVEATGLARTVGGWVASVELSGLSSPAVGTIVCAQEPPCRVHWTQRAVGSLVTSPSLHANGVTTVVDEGSTVVLTWLDRPTP